MRLSGGKVIFTWSIKKEYNQGDGMIEEKGLLHKLACYVERGPFKAYVEGKEIPAIPIPTGLYLEFARSADNPLSFVKAWGLPGIKGLPKTPIDGRPYVPEVLPPESIQEIQEESSRLRALVEIWAIIKKIQDHNITEKEGAAKMLPAFETISKLPHYSGRRSWDYQIPGEKGIAAGKAVLDEHINFRLRHLNLQIEFSLHGAETVIKGATLLDFMYYLFLRDITAGQEYSPCQICGGVMRRERKNHLMHKDCSAKQRAKKHNIRQLIEAISSVENNSLLEITAAYNALLSAGKRNRSVNAIQSFLREYGVDVKNFQKEDAISSLQYALKTKK